VWSGTRDEMKRQKVHSSNIERNLEQYLEKGDNKGGEFSLSILYYHCPKGGGGKRCGEGRHRKGRGVDHSKKGYLPKKKIMGERKGNRIELRVTIPREGK